MTSSLRVLLTGGAGFIGSHLARRILEAGHEVVIVDNLSTGRLANVPRGADLLQLDIASPRLPAALPAGRFDAVCHLAAQSSGPASAQIPYEDLQTNAASTLMLSRWCLERGVPRFLYASSMAVYGDLDATVPVSESSLCVPRSYYGVSKLTSEHLLRLAAVEGLSVTAFRMFSVYGPGQNLENLTQGIVSIFLAYLLRGVEVPVTGSLRRVRDFVYIDDVVDVWMRALLRPSTPAAEYNVGTGAPTTVRQLLDAEISVLGLPADYPVRELASSPFDQFGVYADVTRARVDLEWMPRTELMTGLRAMVGAVRAAGVARG